MTTTNPETAPHRIAVPGGDSSVRARRDPETGSREHVRAVKKYRRDVREEPPVFIVLVQPTGLDGD